MGDREDEILQEIERQSRATTERVRELCRESGREDIVADMDANLKEVRPYVGNATFAIVDDGVATLLGPWVIQGQAR